MRLIDLQGQRFGKLTVIERAGSDKLGHACWRCVCDCGNEHTVVGRYLLRGTTKSCGCMADTGRFKFVHGQVHTKLYHVWSSMIDRCTRPGNQAYKNYGGRGIKVCYEWHHDFRAFYAWAMENGYVEGLSIDRIDNDIGYCPDNCRWVPMEMQNQNQRRNLIFEINGEFHTVAKWCRIYDRNPKTVYARLKRGQTIIRALEIG